MKSFILAFGFLFIFYAGYSQKPLAIPHTLEGSTFNLHLRNGSIQFLSGNATATIGINGNLLGPTILLNKGDSVQFSVFNDLDEPTTMHWHGLHVPAKSDGSPHNVIEAHTVWSPRIKVLDQAGTYWYHPHLHGKTAEQVTKGAAGIIIIRDPEESALILPRDYGLDDFPVVIQSRAFDSGNQFVTITAEDHTILINGTIDPSLEVPAQVVRLRVLNGSTNRVYNLGFQGNHPFFQIGSDGGLLETPVNLTRLMLAPGERAELLVNLTGLKDQSIDFYSFGSELPNGIYGAANPGSMGMGTIAGYSSNILNGKNFRLIHLIVKAQTQQPVTTIPANLINLRKPELSQSSVTRTLTLSASGMGMGSLSGPFLINGQSFSMDRVDFSAKMGATEIWQISNQTAIAHPFHVHGLQFYILDIGGNQPAKSLQGRKDVVLVPAMQTVRLLMRFDDFFDPQTPYMFHCHMLSHEDDGMMGQYLVTGTATGIDNITSGDSQEVNIYPNPFKETLTIEFPRIGSDSAMIDLLTSTGQLYLHKIMTTSPYTIDTSTLIPGLYFARITCGDKVLTMKVIR
ncbi:MAG: T9SS C-terminal target domain-containing protein [Porphyromonadaceae bacterium]|nr:MAG: T9SS C-terminal target domain-containing protein [Porphyromonadaceae bacterium]